MVLEASWGMTPQRAAMASSRAMPLPDSSSLVAAMSVGRVRGSGSVTFRRRWGPFMETVRVVGVPGPMWVMTLVTSSVTQS